MLLKSVRVDVGGNIELGELDPGKPQTLHVTVSRVDGQSVFLSQSILILGKHDILLQNISSLSDDGSAETKLFPGTYDLLMVGGSFCTVRQRFTVAAGAPTTLQIHLRAARRCKLRFPYPKEIATARGLGRLTVRVFDAAGNRVYMNPADPMKGWCYSTEVGLLPGEYRVEARAPWSGRADGRFRVESVGDEPKLVDLPLK